MLSFSDGASGMVPCGAVGGMTILQVQGLSIEVVVAKYCHLASICGRHTQMVTHLRAYFVVSHCVRNSCTFASPVLPSAL